MNSIRRIIRYWLPVVVLCTAIFVQSSYPSSERFFLFAHSDKLMHALAYGILGALIYRALNATAGWRKRSAWLFWASLSAAILYGVSDEWHQSFVAERHADVADLIADAAGSILGCTLYRKTI